MTVAVDSDATVAAAAFGGVREVLIDVDVGLMRCGCDPADAGRLADAARAAGLVVRGVMGYEGHLMMADPCRQGRRSAGVHGVAGRGSHAAVGGDVVSGGGTGTFAVNRWVTELQAGSYCLLDTDYARLDSPFEIAVSVLATVGLGERSGLGGGRRRPQGPRHGPRPPRHGPAGRSRSSPTSTPPFWTPRASCPSATASGCCPATSTATVARHQRYWVVDGDDVIDCWPIDLRHW